MTPAQSKLIYKTFGFLAYLSLTGVIGLLSYGLVWTFVHDKHIIDLLKSLFDIDDAGLAFYPLTGVCVLTFWTRAFLRAGQKQK